MFVSYIGAVVRQNVPITIDNWRDKALKDAKDIIWNDIQVNILIYSFVIYNFDLLIIVFIADNFCS